MLRRLSFLFLLLTFTSSQIRSQIDTVKTIDQFLLPEFSVGIVRMKSGEKVVLDLNYNIVTETMVFKQKGRIYDIVNQASIDTVYVSNRKFIPQGKLFYEVLATGPADLFVQHKGSVIKPSRPAAYGGTSETSSSTYIDNLRMGTQVFRMDTHQEVKIKYDPICLIRKNNEMYLANSSGQLLKILGDKRSQVKEFLKTNKVDFSDPQQVLPVISYYNALPR